MQGVCLVSHSPHMHRIAFSFYSTICNTTTGLLYTLYRNVIFIGLLLHHNKTLPAKGTGSKSRIGDIPILILHSHILGENRNISLL